MMKFFFTVLSLSFLASSSFAGGACDRIAQSQLMSTSHSLRVSVQGAYELSPRMALARMKTAEAVAIPGFNSGIIEISKALAKDKNLEVYEALVQDGKGGSAQQAGFSVMHVFDKASCSVYYSLAYRRQASLR
jgi:hypothetical protein